MIERKLFEDLKRHLVQKEMILLVGPKQAGKTTLMFMLRDYLVTEIRFLPFWGIVGDEKEPYLQYPLWDKNA